MVESDAHQAALDGGLAHFGNLPYIELKGDEAWVTSYLMLVRFDGTAKEVELSNHGLSRGHRIFRVLANRWHARITIGEIAEIVVGAHFTAIHGIFRTHDHHHPVVWRFWEQGSEVR